MFKNLSIIILSFAMALFLVAGLSGLLFVQAAYASPGILYVSATDITCGGHAPCYATIQSAVNAAYDNDEILVAAGNYTDIHNINGLSQVVLITKTVTIRGGYDASFTNPPEPATNPTILNANEQGRVVFIEGIISPTLEGLHITGGFDSSGGGGIQVSNAGGTIRNNQVYSNTGGVGAGISLVSSSAQLINNTVFSNSGTGIYLSQNSPAQLVDNIVVSNTVPMGWQGAGGIQIYWSNAILVGNTISGNSASDSSNDAGGLYIFQSDATLDSNVISSNHGDWGGGIYIGYGSDVTFTNNTVISNTGLLGGGGVYVENNQSTLRDNNIAGNYSGARGGGIYLYQSNSIFENNSVLNNEAETHGGGVVLSYCDYATVDSNLIQDNHAGTGAGFYSRYSNGAVVQNNRIISNEAYTGGGGIRIYKSDIKLINNIVADNLTTFYSSGINIEGSTVDLIHNTIAHNQGGDYSAINISDYDSIYSTVSMTNTIIVSHTLGVYVTTGNTAALEATLWGAGIWANVTQTSGDGIITTGTININSDPAFINPTIHNYHISGASAAINSGSISNVMTDIDDESRDAHPDIGADEAVPYQTLISTNGGEFVLPNGTAMIFPKGAFSETILLTYTMVPTVTTGVLSGPGLFFEIQAVYSSTGEVATIQPGYQYTITIQYNDTRLPNGVDESELSLFWLNSGDWMVEATSITDPLMNTITASPNHMSLWAVLAEAIEENKIYLPLILRE